MIIEIILLCTLFLVLLGFIAFEHRKEMQRSNANVLSFNVAVGEKCILTIADNGGAKTISLERTEGQDHE